MNVLETLLKENALSSKVTPTTTRSKKIQLDSIKSEFLLCGLMYFKLRLPLVAQMNSRIYQSNNFPMCSLPHSTTYTKMHDE